MVGAQDPVLRPLSEALEGAVQAEIGRRDAAIAAWNRALAARPQEASWHYALAGPYLGGGGMGVGAPPPVPCPQAASVLASCMR